MSINYLLATWAGDKRRNPSTEYLKVHLDKLFNLQHNLNEIIVIRPKGSYCDEFYQLPDDILKRIKILYRSTNDRSFGQFLYACNKVPVCDYFILAEDDYIPVVDNFDTILKDTLKEKGADYLCGRYHNQNLEDPLYPEMNIGIVKASSLLWIVCNSNNLRFPVNGIDDGTEKLIFAKLFTDFGFKIDDYSDRYAVPYWDRYLRYLTPNRGQALFEPFQKLMGKAFTYDWSTAADKPDFNSHFLMNIDFIGPEVFIDDKIIGRCIETNEGYQVHIPEIYHKQVGSRLRYVNRMKEITIKFL